MSKNHSSCCQNGSCSCCCCHQHSQSSGTCSSSHEDHDRCSFSQQLLELADEAWMELLKEKIKAKIEAKGGAQLDQLAQLISDSNNSRWKSKICEKNCEKEFKHKLGEFFSHCQK